MNAKAIMLILVLCGLCGQSSLAQLPLPADDREPKFTYKKYRIPEGFRKFTVPKENPPQLKSSSGTTFTPYRFMIIGESGRMLYVNDTKEVHKKVELEVKRAWESYRKSAKPKSSPPKKK